MVHCCLLYLAKLSWWGGLSRVWWLIGREEPTKNRVRYISWNMMIYVSFAIFFCSFIIFCLIECSVTWRRQDLDKFYASLALWEESAGHRWIPLTKGQLTDAIILSLLLARKSCWTKTPFTGNLRRYHAHMTSLLFGILFGWSIEQMYLLQNFKILNPINFNINCALELAKATTINFSYQLWKLQIIKCNITSLCDEYPCLQEWAQFYNGFSIITASYSCVFCWC